MRVRLWSIPLIAAGLLAGCADLAPIELGVCGNGIVEAANGEDCDSVASEGLQCGQPGMIGQACRFVCASSSTEGPHCPEGWACGGDGLCRFSSGAFSEGVQKGRFLGPVEFLASGDFDGDGRGDLFALTNGAVSIRFGGSGGDIASEFDLPFPSIGRPAIGDLDLDGRTDVVVPQAEGLVVFKGDRDRSLSPVPNSQLGDLDIGDADLELIPYWSYRLAGQMFGLLLSSPEAVCFTIGAEVCSVAGASNQSYGFARANPGPGIGPTSSSARFSTATGVTEIAIVAAGESRVHVVRIGSCGETESGCLSRARIVDARVLEFADGNLRGLDGRMLRATGRVLHADYDGDGLQDLLVGVQYPSGVDLGSIFGGTYEAPSNGVLVALADGMNGFEPLVLEPSFHRLARPADIVRDGAFSRARLSFPLAAGDLDDDGATDYVGTEGVFLVSKDPVSGAQLQLVGTPSLGHWSEAIIADFNQDSRLDVAASSGEVEGIDFLQGTGLGLLNPSRIDTSGPSQLLRFGDFDGDLVGDVAFVELTPTTQKDERGETIFESTLKISFGNLQGPPSPPIEIGPLDEIQDLRPLFIPDGDLISDLIVESSRRVLIEETNQIEERTSFAFLTGTTSRRMFSTIAPPVQESAEPTGTVDPGLSGDRNRSVAVQIGRFDSTDGSPDLLMVRKDDQWVLKSAGGASFPVDGIQSFDWATACSGLDYPVDPTCAAVTVGRIDASDANDSIVTFENLRRCGHTTEDRARLVIITPQAPGVAPICRHQELGALSGGIPTAVQLLDLDRNGLEELLVVYGYGEAATGRAVETAPLDGSGEWRPADPELTTVEQSGLAVYWNLSASAVEQPTQADFEAADVVAAGDYAGATVGAAPSMPGDSSDGARSSIFGEGESLVPGFIEAVPLNADADPEVELALLSTEGLFIADFVEGSPVPVLWAVRWAAHDTSNHLITTDANQDGLDDIVLTDGPDFEYLLARPHDEGRPEAR